MMVRRWLPALLLALSWLAVSAWPARAAEDDALADVKARRAIEAQRVEKEFKEGRAAAYKLARASEPKLVEATEQLHTLLAMVRSDTSLTPERRKTLIDTLNFDLSNVKKIAGETRRGAAMENRIAREIKNDITRRTRADEDPPRRRTDVARDVIDSRRSDVDAGRINRKNTSDRIRGALDSVDRSNMIVKGNVEFPRDWVEKSRKRGETQPITAKEKAIIKALNKTISVDFDGAELQDVLDLLRKETGVDIAVDKKAMDEASVTYKTPVTLKLKGTFRTILKRLLGDLGLAYIVKDEAVQVVSIEKAKTETTIRKYYLGDLAAVTDVRYGPLVSQALMIQRINQLINTITSTIEPKSWQVNNPDAVGVITFHAPSMMLIVKQTAEIHYSLSGYR